MVQKVDYKFINSNFSFIFRGRVVGADSTAGVTPADIFDKFWSRV